MEGERREEKATRQGESEATKGLMGGIFYAAKQVRMV